MPRVIDTISVTEALRRNCPGLEASFEGDGRLAVLDPDEETDVSNAAGQRALIFRPEGSRIEWEIAGAEVWHGVAALSLAGLSSVEVPRLSVVTWDST